MGQFTGPVPLGPKHQVDGFDCGSPAQTEWLRRWARIAQDTDTGRVYVTTPADSAKVVGYYALATGAVAQADATARVRAGAGRYPISVIILTRLGVDLSVQGHGVGRSLVRDALLRVEQAADLVGVRALLIHAESDGARDFYQHVAEFEESPGEPLHLLLTLEDLRTALQPDRP